MKCQVPECISPAKRVKSKSTGHSDRWCWSHGKYCSMHYERKRKRGTFGTAEREVPSAGSIGAKHGYEVQRKEYVHRIVWRRERGSIPPGHHIHHRNGIKTDNRIENLECLSESEHHKLHRRPPSKKR